MAMSNCDEFWIQPGDWKSYEAYVTGALVARFPGIRIKRDVHVTGRRSQISRQIDILVESSSLIAIECKHYKQKVDVKHVESFLSMMDDLGVKSGIIITSAGYTKGAYARSKNDPRKLDLQILAPERLSDYQSLGSPIIWQDSCGFALTSPPGWITDDELTDVPGGVLIAMYPLGHSIQSAARFGEFMYANILSKPYPSATLDELAAIHQSNILADAPMSTFIFESRSITDASGHIRNALLRTAHIEENSFGLEHALYMDFEDAVLLLVLLSSPRDIEQQLLLLFGVAESCFSMAIQDCREIQH